MILRRRSPESSPKTAAEAENTFTGLGQAPVDGTMNISIEMFIVPLFYDIHIKKSEIESYKIEQASHNIFCVR